MDNILKALQGAATDEALVSRFLSVWPVIESLLDSSSKATALTIFVFLNRVKIFQSSPETLPLFCGLMLGDPDTARLCVEDGIRRAEGGDPEFAEGVQYCHAGLITDRRDVDTGCVGVMSILYSARHSADELSLERRRSVIESIKLQAPALADRLQYAADIAQTDSIQKKHIVLMDEIVDIVNSLLRATVDMHSLTITLAHELSVTMLGVGLLAGELKHRIDEVKNSPSEESFGEIYGLQSHLFTESRLALFTVRNFLSHASETRYSQVTKPKFINLNLKSILLDMIDLYKRPASSKQIDFDLSSLPDLPPIRGVEMEIRRMFHNVLNNAVKYSYHSIRDRHRTIKIKAKVPYDPGFKERRFSILFENYGLGVTEAEKRRVFKSGFRGQQAIAEMPIGSGIGLSEALKIMRVHGGEIKFTSKELHKEADDETYLTTIELVFPFTQLDPKGFH